MMPEQYWIERGSDVIGQDVVRLGSKARQAVTYMCLVKLILDRYIHDVLDAGCNYGTLQWWLDTFNYDGWYKGVDSNPHAVELGKQRGSRVELGNLRKLDYPDQSFECVVVKDVLEHLENYEPLAEAFRVAKEWVMVAVYLPWIVGPSQIRQMPDGYYTNTYNKSEVLGFAASHRFSLHEEKHVSESDGRPNDVYIFRRVQL